MNKDMSQDDFAKTILQKIQTEKIKPRSKKYFTLYKTFLWIPGILITFLGGFAWAGILFNSFHSSLKYREFIHPGAGPFLLRELPWVWIILFLFFSLIIIKAFRKTKNGYKYSPIYILMFSILVSLFLGFVFLKLDSYIKNPLLRLPTERIQKNLWFNPEEGRLMGRLFASPENILTIEDINGKKWTLEIDSNIFIPLDQTNSFVRIVGIAKDDNVFYGCIILPGKFEKDQSHNMPPPKPFISQNKECKETLEKVRQSAGERKLQYHP